MDAGVLPSLADASRVLRHALTNCLGGNYEQVKVETHALRLANDDRLLLCTDGLSDMVPEADIARVLAEHADPQPACRALVDRALANGGKDNVTVVIARYTVAGS